MYYITPTSGTKENSYEKTERVVDLDNDKSGTDSEKRDQYGNNSIDAAMTHTVLAIDLRLRTAEVITVVTGMTSITVWLPWKGRSLQ